MIRPLRFRTPFCQSMIEVADFSDKIVLKINKMRARCDFI